MKEKLQERRYACDYEGCGRAFSRQFNLKAHKKTHEDCRDRPFECPICNQRFFRNHDLTRHSTVHTKVKEWKCESCDKEFTRKDALARHVLRQCGTAAADLE
ncbi:uncharacterized protein BJ171DRAFT_428056 [Polychytrium aggregatum]|uniref:uncharacterized protein n=1 Tax=Polychytrium aggregatum TaxID=110093 RepID=UPI0022FED980|nr:uncharacterized protein BJ171DRAFT_428056 [Polychytrium aggregatum]KAI9197477.1 hypothetical protein BJ171DRAFT_428056 [Polychytrium aggregatum]